MGRAGDDITPTEKFKIAGIIGVAVFVVSMMIWSSFEAQIQQSLNGFFEGVHITFSRIYNTLMLTVYYFR
jgi:hypothetical protein